MHWEDIMREPWGEVMEKYWGTVMNMGGGDLRCDRGYLGGVAGGTGEVPFN